MGGGGESRHDLFNHRKNTYLIEKSKLLVRLIISLTCWPFLTFIKRYGLIFVMISVWTTGQQDVRTSDSRSCSTCDQSDYYTQTNNRYGCHSEGVQLELK